MKDQCRRIGHPISYSEYLPEICIFSSHVFLTNSQNLEVKLRTESGKVSGLLKSLVPIWF